VNNFLKTQKTNILNADGKALNLAGVNLGGWLLMEGYILHSLNHPEQKFKREFVKMLGPAALKDFEKTFRDNFIGEEDIKTIAGIGFNCLRVPFNHRLVEIKPFQYSLEGVAYLDRVIEWAKKYKLLVILDLHAAAGAQNHDWHSDSLGKAQLWTKEIYRRRTYALWEFLADRYQDEPTVAGYDLLNEAVLENTALLNRFYKELIRVIRKVDRRHILFVEGNRWAQDLDCLECFKDDNIALSIHCYAPLEFTHNFIPQLRYPLKNGKSIFNKTNLRDLMGRYAKIAQRRSCPVFAGEFGVNARGGLYGEDLWLRDILACFKEFNFHWAYWTYKAVKNAVCPDGIFSYFPNEPWISRHGPVLGWDTYKVHWPSQKKEMTKSWRTENFLANKEILQTLRHAL